MVCGDTMQFSRICLLSSWVWFASACVVPFNDGPSGSPDGARCDVDDDCRSGTCTSMKLCAHSRCDCPGDTCTEGGEVSSDCAKGWRCVYYDSLLEDIGAFFGQERDYDGGLCQVPCTAGCPEHYMCSPGGIWCEPDWQWVYPVPTIRWTGAANGMLTGRDQTTNVTLEIGKSVTLTAEATSPLGMSIDDFVWTASDWNGATTQVKGHTTTFMLEEQQSSGRVDLQVMDPDSRTGVISVQFQGCSGTGEMCGWQGSGCCAGCDEKKEFCL
jgi:hypothetical protein